MHYDDNFKYTMMIKMLQFPTKVNSFMWLIVLCDLHLIDKGVMLKPFFKRKTYYGDSF